MRMRPFALVGFTYLLTLAAAVYLGPNVSLFFACLLLLLFLLSLAVPFLRRKRTVPAAMLIAAVGFFVYFFAYTREVTPLLSYDGKDAVISGTICELPYEANGRCYYILETDCVKIEKEEPAQKIKLRISSEEAIEADVYDRITAQVHLFAPEGGSGFDSESYYASKGIYLLSYLPADSTVQVLPAEKRPLYYYALKARKEMLSALRVYLPVKEAALVSGVLLGDKYSLSKETKNDFRQAGVSHLLAVSGLHMTVIAQFLFAIFLFLKIPRRLAALLAAAGVFCFMAVTGFVPSVARAGIMCILTLLGLVIHRRSDPLNSLGISVLILTLFNPFAAGDVGLLLSFSAALGLIVLSPVLRRALNRKLASWGISNRFTGKIASALSVSFSAVIFTFPVMMLSFREISLVFPISNLLSVYPAGIMLTFGALAVLLSFVPFLSFLAQGFFLLTGMIAKYLIWCVHLISSLPFASVSVSEGYLFLWFLGSLLLFGLAFLLGKGKKLKKMTVLLSAILLLVGIFSHQIFSRNVLQVSVLDVGDGCAVTLCRDNRTAVLSASGGYTLEDELTAFLDTHRQKTFDLLLLPEWKRENPALIRKLIKEHSPSILLISDEEELDESLRVDLLKKENISFYEEKAEVTLWGDIEIKGYVCPGGNWLSFEANGKRFLVCPTGGDVRDISAKVKRADFLIVGGEIKNGERLSFDCLVFSCTKESSEEHLYKFYKTEFEAAPAYITAGNGCIRIDLSEDGEVKIRREF